MLASALVAVQEAHIPWRWLKPAGPITTRFLIGRNAADALDIHAKGPFVVRALLRVILGITRAFDALFAALGAEFSIVRFLARVLARRIVQPLLDDQTRPLVIRSELLDRWNLEAPSARVG
jgi:hypothetical protein